MANLAGLIREPVHRVFRRAYIKRRSATTGLYESTWYEITDLVKSWGTFTIAVDDLRRNRFTHSGVSLRVKNDQGQFNHEDQLSSLWHGYLTRYRSLVKIEAGYLDANDNEYPTDTTQGIFIMDGELPETPKTNDIVLNCKSIVSPLQETRASEVTGITTGGLTASGIVAKIRDATDGSGNFLFREFVTSTAWSIQATTNIYNFLHTTTAVDQYTVWDLLVKLAEAENFVVNATREGGIVFGDRTANTTASQFSLFGGKFNRPNIIGLNNAKEAVNKLYTHVRIKYADADTATSYVNQGAAVQVNNSSTAWKYGRRTYEFENTWLDQSTASLIASNLVTSFGNLKIETDIDAKFLPHLAIFDRVDVSYRDNNIHNDRLWDTEAWASDTATDAGDGLSWDDETGTSIEWNVKNFVVLSIRTNLDNFTSTLVLREAET